MGAVLENIKTRRSIRSFRPDAVPQALLDEIMEAGLYAASAMGSQDTIIVEVTNREIRDQLARMNARIGGWEEGFDPFYGAPAVLIVLAKKDSPYRVYDGSVVMDNMMLEAHDLGLGSCWIHRAKEEFETDWGKDLLRTRGITEEYEGVGHCVVGFIAGNAPDAPARKEGRVYKIQ